MDSGLSVAFAHSPFVRAIQDIASSTTTPRLVRHPDVSQLTRMSGALPFVYVFAAKKWQATTHRRRLCEIGSSVVTSDNVSVSFTKYEVFGAAAFLERFTIDNTDVCRLLVSTEHENKTSPQSMPITLPSPDASSASTPNDVKSIIMDSRTSVLVVDSPNSARRSTSFVNNVSEESISSFASEDLFAEEGLGASVPTAPEPRRAFDTHLRVALLEDMFQRECAYSMDIVEGWNRWRPSGFSYANRPAVIDALDDVCVYVAASPVAFHLAMSMLDRYICITHVPTISNLELKELILVCIFIACKNADVNPPSMQLVKSALDGCGVTTRTEQLHTLELHVLQTLGFRLQPLTCLETATFLLFQECPDAHKAVFSLSKLLADFMLRQKEYADYGLVELGAAIASVSAEACALNVDRRSMANRVRVTLQRHETCADMVRKCWHQRASTPRALAARHSEEMLALAINTL